MTTRINTTTKAKSQITAIPIVKLPESLKTKGVFKFDLDKNGFIESCNSKGQNELFMLQNSFIPKSCGIEDVTIFANKYNSIQRTQNNTLPLNEEIIATKEGNENYKICIQKGKSETFVSSADTGSDVYDNKTYKLNSTRFFDEDKFGGKSNVGDILFMDTKYEYDENGNIKTKTVEKDIVTEVDKNKSWVHVRRVTCIYDKDNNLIDTKNKENIEKTYG